MSEFFMVGVNAGLALLGFVVALTLGALVIWALFALIATIVGSGRRRHHRKGNQ